MTNAKQPAKWPHLAAGCRDEAQFLAHTIVSTARQVQVLILAGESQEAIIQLGDIRDNANKIVWRMVQAGTGHYEEAAAVQDAAARRTG